MDHYMITSSIPGEGGGEYSKTFWVGVCRWDSETLTLNQTKFSCTLKPYITKVKNAVPYPKLRYFPDTRSQTSQTKISFVYNNH